jgi:hypothetical protein
MARNRNEVTTETTQLKMTKTINDHSALLKQGERTCRQVADKLTQLGADAKKRLADRDRLDSAMAVTASELERAAAAHDQRRVSDLAQTIAKQVAAREVITREVTGSFDGAAAIITPIEDLANSALAVAPMASVIREHWQAIPQYITRALCNATSRNIDWN